MANKTSGKIANSALNAIACARIAQPSRENETPASRRTTIRRRTSVLYS